MSAHQPQQHRVAVPPEICSRVRTLCGKHGRTVICGRIGLGSEYLAEIVSGYGVLRRDALDRLSKKLDVIEKELAT